MLLTRQKQDPSKPQLNMASMIDVVFLLLIFFMCTSSFTQIEDNLPTQLTQINSASAQQSAELPPVRISLKRSASGTVVITCENDTFMESDTSGLLKKLEQLRTIDDIRVIIDGQGSVPFGSMVKVLDICYQAKLGRVAFSAEGDVI
jgi:biopolymer transport protein ExbD